MTQSEESEPASSGSPFFSLVRSSWGADLIALAILLVLIAIKTWERLHFPEWLSRTDIVNQYLPWWGYLGEQLRSGNVPGWNPYQFGGTPFLGDPQSGWMYLPVMVPFTLFDPLTAIKFYVAVHLLVGGLSTYVFARLLSLRPLGALTAAIAFTFGPFIQHTTYCCNIQAHVAAWLPLGLLGVEWAVRARTWSSRLVGWGITGVSISQMLAGWIGQGTYNGLLVLGAYLTYRVLLTSVLPKVAWTERIRWLAVHGFAILAIGLGLGAAAGLPRFEVTLDTNLAGGSYGNVEDLDENRGATLDEMTSSILAPWFRSRRTTIGAITLVLAMVGAVVAWRRPPIPFFAVHTIVVLAMSLESTLLHHIFYLLPRYRELHEHAPSRVLAVLMIGPAILAGVAVERIPRLSRGWGFVAAAIPLLGLALITLTLREYQRQIVSFRQPTMQAIVVVTLLIAALAFGRTTWGAKTRLTAVRAWIPVLIVAVLIWEPSGRDLVGQIRSSPLQPRTIQVAKSNMSKSDFSSAGDFLLLRLSESDEPFRYIGYNALDLRSRHNTEGVVYHNRHWSPGYRRLLIGPRSIVLGLYHLQGYNPIQLKRTVDLFLSINQQPLEYHDAYILPQGMSSPWIDVYSVQYVVVPPDVPPGRPDLLHLNQRNHPVFDNGEIRVLRNDDAFPYAWIVHEARKEDRSTAIDLIQTGAVDPRSVALLEPGTDVPELEPPSNPRTESIDVADYDEDYIQIEATLDSAGIVILSETHNPGWKVTVDGHEEPLLLVNGVLRGVAVPAGQHTIELEYAPLSIPLGMATSAMTALLLVIGVVATRRKLAFGSQLRSSIFRNSRVSQHSYAVERYREDDAAP